MFPFYTPLKHQKAISIPPEKVRKPLVFWHFQEGTEMIFWYSQWIWNGNIDQIWVNVKFVHYLSPPFSFECERLSSRERDLDLLSPERDLRLSLDRERDLSLLRDLRYMIIKTVHNSDHWKSALIRGKEKRERERDFAAESNLWIHPTLREQTFWFLIHLHLCSFHLYLCFRYIQLKKIFVKENKKLFTTIKTQTKNTNLSQRNIKTSSCFRNREASKKFQMARIVE